MGKGFGKVGALTDLPFGGNKSRHRRAIFEQNEGDIVIADQVHAFGKVTRSFGNADYGLLH